MATTLITNNNIEKALSELAPDKIAVAYLGDGWNNFIDPKKLNEIILSPTRGTNPEAVEQVVKEIGWGQVFFFDALHAKIYLNTDKKQVVIGSFNLSDNGVSTDKLHEIGILSDDKQIFEEAYKEYEHIKEKAKNEYKNEASKTQQLEYLAQIPREYSSWNGNLKTKEKPVNIHDYIFKKKTIHVMWYWAWDCDVGLNVDEHDQSIIYNWTHCLPGDKIVPRQWVLLWPAKNNGTPHENQNPSWLFIHTKKDKGVIGNDVGKYSTLLAELNTDIPKPPEPFELTREVINSIRKILNKKAFIEFRPNENKDDEDESYWSANQCSEELKEEFIKEVKKEVKKTRK